MNVSTNGILAPGVGAGSNTLSVASVAFQTGGTFAVGLTTGASDRLNVTGTATLTGGVLTANKIGAGSLTNPYTVITAGSGVVGKFSNPGNIVMVGTVPLTIIYDATSVKLQVGGGATMIIVQ